MVKAKPYSRQKLRGWLLPDRSFNENIVVGLFICCLPFFLQWLFFPLVTHDHGKWSQNKVKDDLDLSVVAVVPTYNKEYFQDTVIPFLSTWCEKEELTYEIIVVNDGSSSSDGPMEVPLPNQQQPTEYMKIVQLAEGKQGLGFAMKYGVNEAQASRYVLTGDDDVTVVTYSQFLQYTPLSFSYSHTYPHFSLSSYLKVENDGLFNIRHTLPNLFNELRNTIDSSSSLLHKFGALAVTGTTTSETIWTTNVFMQRYWWLMKLICSRQNIESSHTRLFAANTAKFLFNSLHLETDTFDIELIFMAELLRIPIVEVPVQITKESNVLTSNLNLPVLLLEKLMKTLTMARDTLILRIAYLLEIWHIDMHRF